MRAKQHSSLQATAIYTHTDRLLALPCVPSQSSDLDKKGTKLWNLASKLKKTDAVNGELVCLSKEAKLPLELALKVAQYGFLAACSSTMRNDVHMTQPRVSASSHHLYSY